LRNQAGVPDSTPILPVRDLHEAVEFYDRAGFNVGLYNDGGFAFVNYDDESVFDLDPGDRVDPATNRAGCYIIVPRVDGWHAEMSAAGLPVTTVQDQPWEMREVTLTDPSGNYIRIGRST
jgi:uncharacterized glyoxalase superfamily protein PhnB